MKTKLLVILFAFVSLVCKSQNKDCVDVFGNECECPTSEDSILVYENSLKVYQFYERNEYYKKIKIKKIVTEKDVYDCFQKLDSAYRAFMSMWMLRERYLKGENVDVLMPRGGKNIPISDYFEKVDEYRFYQREFECGILNTSSPFPVYDIRIAPLYINTYRNHTSDDVFNGDEVQIAMYMPVTVKPFMFLTEKELEIRNKVLMGTSRNKKVKKVVPEVVKIVKKDTTPVVVKAKPLTIKFSESGLVKNDTTYKIVPESEGVPVYYSNGITGSLIGFLSSKGVFTRIDKSQYKYIHKFAVDLLQDIDKLKKELKIKFGQNISIIK
jgi:hypothetical protein